MIVQFITNIIKELNLQCVFKHKSQYTLIEKQASGDYLGALGRNFLN